MDKFALPRPSHISVTELLLLGLATTVSEKSSGPCQLLVTVTRFGSPFRKSPRFFSWIFVGILEYMNHLVAFADSGCKMKH